MSRSDRMICSYCNSENNSSYAERCNFCDAPLKAARPNFDRIVTEEDYIKPFPTLAAYHTYHLLLLLKKVRAERTRMYKLMRTLQKAPEDFGVDSDTLVFAESEYREFTARMKVIEGILIDRMGYKPKRVDDKLLENLLRKIENY